MSYRLERGEPAAGGVVVWLITMALGVAGGASVTLVEAMLLFGIVVVVPLAVPLHPAAGRFHPGMALLAGTPTAPALLLEQGVSAGLLALPWLALCGTAAVLAIRWWLSRERTASELVWVAAAVYLAVGGAWLVADRLDLEPAGFAAPFVQLTAIHFHFAGFAASVLAGCAMMWRRTRLSVLAATLIVVAPPVVALGFTFYGPLQIAGAVLLTVGLWLLAWETVRVGVAVGGLVGTLLFVSAVATLVPMILAVQWAVGANYGTPALSIPDMARWHGVANAVGFAFLGAVGWRLAAHHESVSSLP